jgi:hypothetical protein
VEESGARALVGESAARTRVDESGARALVGESAVPPDKPNQSPNTYIILHCSSPVTRIGRHSSGQLPNLSRGAVGSYFASCTLVQPLLRQPTGEEIGRILRTWCPVPCRAVPCRIRSIAALLPDSSESDSIRSSSSYRVL